MKVECPKCHEWVEMNAHSQKCSVCGWDLLKGIDDEIETEKPKKSDKTKDSRKEKKPKSDTIYIIVSIIIIVVEVTY